MAKRAAPDEKPYRPLLDTNLVNAVIAQVAPGNPTVQTQQQTTMKVLEMPRTENVRGGEAHRFSTAELPAKAQGAEKQSRQPQELAQKFDQEKRILFTRSETQAIDRLVTSLASRLNSQVKVSHLMRALVSLLLNAEPEVHKRAGEAGLLVRPPNGDGQALQRFEREIARIIGAAITDAGPIR
jgi:hypothetical protein